MEKGLAHDYKCRDVDDKVGGQIMEVQPVVKHQSTDKRVERESQPADEMGEKYHPLLGLWGGYDLSLGWKSMSDVHGQVPGLPEFLDVLLLDGGGHPLASSSGSGHGWSASLGGES